ncbi:hypothetical protein M0657_006930 [Pyricularia oryzae]|uniref:Uncharacterized protein n=1 Tax=Pyricularia oryzae TaxID=318829 RepID=A0A4P7NEU0_PYROR|nr:hypothetical protein M9X92_006442 [Pyricularia oryzae]KAI7919790.1 hypothetical protein M0657_006930 [Pyricularia oryzae]QBZ60377.1 hypothetical protein PoMZ_07318 [Pyricularia oryzae]
MNLVHLPVWYQSRRRLAQAYPHTRCGTVFVYFPSLGQKEGTTGEGYNAPSFQGTQYHQQQTDQYLRTRPTNSALKKKSSNLGSSGQLLDLGG